MTENELYESKEMVQSKSVSSDKDGNTNSLDNQICTIDIETEESTDQD